MRFRRGTTGQGQNPAVQGVGSFFNAMALAPLYRAQAEDDALLTAARRNAYETNAQADRARATLYETQAGDITGRQARGTPGEMLRTAFMMRGGLPTQFDEFEQVATTGQMPGQYVTPTDGIGPVAPTPQHLDPQFMGRVMQTLGLTRAGLAAEDKNIDNVAQAAGRFQTQDVLDQVLAGRTGAAPAARAVAASKGNKLVDNIGNTGMGYDQFSGQGVTLDAGLRTLFGEGERAQINQRNAAAGASGASGKLADSRRARVEQGLDRPVTIVDEDTGEATVTALPTQGAPRSIGVKPAGGTGADATNAKERNRVVAAIEKDPMFATASDAEIKAEVDRRMARRAPAKPAKGAPAPAPAGANPAPTSTPPLNLLSEGKKVTFKNGQVWTLRQGQPVQLK
jgi:hypothetical protein